MTLAMSAASMHVEGSWTALTTRGFAVIRGFFSQGELERLRDAHRRAPRADVAVYAATEPARSDIALCMEKIRSLLPEIRRSTDLLTDTVVPQGVFFATEQMNLGWHSDQKSDYLFQGHLHHLTFWMPIDKPCSHRSGLAVLPMDRLREHAPELHRAVVGRGSARCEEGLFCYEDGVDDRKIPCPFDPDAVAATPAIAEGDALVFRSDVLHRTQDADTPRVALSMRAVRAEHRLTARRFLAGSARKRARMLGEPNAFCEALAAFLLHGRSDITVREYLDTRERLARKELAPRLAFASARVLLPQLLAAERLRQTRTRRS